MNLKVFVLNSGLKKEHLKIIERKLRLINSLILNITIIACW